MGVEIERKFLVVNDSWKESVSKIIDYEQGYLCTESGRTVRVRSNGETGYITVKGKKSGLVTPEYEYEIPVEDCLEILRNTCIQPTIRKKRHHVVYAGALWEIDVFEGENSGLVVAEVELCSEHEVIEAPPWIGDEVTGDRRYSNAALAETAFSTWTAKPIKKQTLGQRILAMLNEYW